MAGAAPAILWDWNWFKVPLAARLSLAADRSVTIDGPLAVRLSRVTHVRLQGLIGDRDIVTRAVAEGYDPDECYVREIMSPDVMWCYEDETADDLARNMANLQVKRLPVLSRDKRLAGIVSLGDLALVEPAQRQAQEALAGISQPAYSPLEGPAQTALY